MGIPLVEWQEVLGGVLDECALAFGRPVEMPENLARDLARAVHTDPEYPDGSWDRWERLGLPHFSLSLDEGEFMAWPLVLNNRPATFAVVVDDEGLPLKPAVFGVHPRDEGEAVRLWKNAMAKREAVPA